MRGHSIIVRTHDVILRHLRLRLGDALLTSGEADEADGLTLNGVNKNTYNVVLDHMSLLWGTDIGGLAILGNVHDVTVQNSIIGEGLFHSRMPASQNREGHSMGANIVAMDASQTPPQRITFYRNLFTTSDARMPRLQGARCVDLVNNVIYNWGTHAATGNPRSANLVGQLVPARASHWHALLVAAPAQLSRTAPLTPHRCSPATPSWMASPVAGAQTRWSTPPPPGAGACRCTPARSRRCTTPC